MAERVNIDPESRALIRSIEAITDPAEFSAVATALEAVLARRIKHEAGPTDLGPAWTIVTGQMVARHVMALLDCKDLADD
jgi:hypothetical protein